MRSWDLFCIYSWEVTQKLSRNNELQQVLHNQNNLKLTGFWLAQVPEKLFSGWYSWFGRSDSFSALISGALHVSAEKLKHMGRDWPAVKRIEAYFWNQKMRNIIFISRWHHTVRNEMWILTELINEIANSELNKFDNQPLVDASLVSRKPGWSMKRQCDESPNANWGLTQGILNFLRRR